jgi:hypothetical protein
MHLWIHIEFTKILGQFKQKKICWFIHDFLIVNYNILKKLLRKFHDHLFICSIWINFAKKRYVEVWIW